MTISELIAALQAIKALHGDVDVTTWEYDGGLDALRSVRPAFDAEIGFVVLETSRHESGLRR